MWKKLTTALTAAICTTALTGCMSTAPTIPEAEPGLQNIPEAEPAYDNGSYTQKDPYINVVNELSGIQLEKVNYLKNYLSSSRGQGLKDMLTAVQVPIYVQGSDSPGSFGGLMLQEGKKPAPILVVSNQISEYCDISGNRRAMTLQPTMEHEIMHVEEFLYNFIIQQYNDNLKPYDLVGKLAKKNETNIGHVDFSTLVDIEIEAVIRGNQFREPEEQRITHRDGTEVFTCDDVIANASAHHHTPYRAQYLDVTKNIPGYKPLNTTQKIRSLRQQGWFKDAVTKGEQKLRSTAQLHSYQR